MKKDLSRFQVDNYVKVKSTGEHLLISGVDRVSITSECGRKFDLDKIEGILINRNWLKCLGFDCWKNYNNTFSLGTFMINKRVRRNAYVTRKSSPDMHFVHELQNRYSGILFKSLLIKTK